MKVFVDTGGWVAYKEIIARIPEKADFGVLTCLPRRRCRQAESEYSVNPCYKWIECPSAIEF